MIVRSIDCKGDEGFGYEDEEVDVGVELKSRDVEVGTTAGMDR